MILRQERRDLPQFQDGPETAGVWKRWGLEDRANPKFDGRAHAPRYIATGKSTAVFRDVAIAGRDPSAA
jgi:hypothetical protein